MQSGRHVSTCSALASNKHQKGEDVVAQSQGRGCDVEMVPCNCRNRRISLNIVENDPAKRNKGLYN